MKLNIKYYVLKPKDPQRKHVRIFIKQTKDDWYVEYWHDHWDHSTHFKLKDIEQLGWYLTPINYEDLVLELL